MNQVEFGFNWTYVDNRDIAYFSSGRLPIRPASVDLGLPTNGDGDYEWRGFLSQKAHPQAINPPGRRARQLEQQAGARVRRRRRPLVVRLAPARAAALATRSRGTGKYSPASVVAAMNTAATQDFRVLEVLPSIAAVLAGTTAPSARDQQMLDLLESWRASGGSRLDLDLDGKIDDPGAAIMDAAWPRIARAVMSPVLGPRCPTSRPSSRSTTRPTTRAPPTTAAGTATSTRTSAR